VAGMAPRPRGRRPGAEIPHRVPVARHLRRAARRRPVAPRHRARREPLVPRGQGVGLAPDPQPRRATQLASGPGGEPGGRRRERPVRRGGRLVWPTAFALYNWAAQWSTYHLVLRATHVPVSSAASFTALIVVNLGGLLRPTPANVGVTQAALVVGLLPFGVAPEHAVAAGLALQGLQVLPVLFLGAMVTGWRLLQLESELA